MLRKARDFFYQRNVMEVDCPALSLAAPIDLHIDVMKVLLKNAQIGYLHTSAEYGMKQLLSLGSGDIYQISHVFRDGEIGPLHNPEFTMTEWYRIGFSFEQMIEETLDFIHLFLGPLPSAAMTYRKALHHYLQLDYLYASRAELLTCARMHNLNLPQEAVDWDRDTLLQALVTFVIEPQLAHDHLFVLTHFPASQAALSQTETLSSGEPIAYRFEIYYQGIELANGYHELTDAKEQRSRLEQANRARLIAGKDALKIDQKFLEALERGIPDCSGVAVGFDRLLQLQTGAKQLSAVIPIPAQWDICDPP